MALEPGCPQPRVLVIGAGLAGLSAAQRLIECGITDLTVLEALPRPGGRINTLLIDGTPFDLGAATIFGCCQGNPVYTLACQEGVIRAPLTRIKGCSGVACFPGGRPVKSEVYKASWRMFSEILRNCRKSKNTQGNEDMWSYLSKEIEKVVKYFPEKDRAMAKRVMYSLTGSIQFATGTDLNVIPVTKFALKKRIKGGDLFVDNGMSSVLKSLMKTVKESKIQFNKVVKKIHWDPRYAPRDSRVVVSTCDKGTYYADYVISTIPLGVLKALHRDLFEPPLPDHKINSIMKIGQGHVNAVCIKYKKPFWLPRKGNTRTCWPLEVMMKGEQWIHGVGLIQEIHNAPDSLRMVVAGNAAKQLETLPDQQILNDVTMMIRCFLGDPSLPAPSHVIRSNWTSDRHFRGGISYLGEGGSGQDQLELAEPLPTDDIAPALLFAGEATVTGHQGTVHGARISGVREAERILKFTKCFCGPPPKPMRYSCSFDEF